MYFYFYFYSNLFCFHLGKLVPNMILLGYKNNWMTDLENVSGYINVLHHGFDVHLSGK
jgi:hypothetical protein